VRRTHNLTGDSLDRLLRSRPRYLLHGVVAAVGVVAASTIVFQSRPSTPAVAQVSVPAAPQPQVSAPLVPLGIARPATVLDDWLEPRPAIAHAPEAPPVEIAKPSVHTVEEGETLRMLAAKYGLDPMTIMAANGLRNPDLLKIGQDLVIPPTDGVLYTLRAGETIGAVAEKFGVDTMDIIKADDLGPDPDLVQPGTLLMVPGAEPQAAARAAVVVRTSDGEQQIAAVGPGIPLPVDATEQLIPSTRTYEVQTGDTLAGIAETFGVDVATLLSNNGIDNPDRIKPGFELRILPVSGLEYTIQADETLADIAWRYQVDLGLLLDYNDLNDPDMIRIGAKLVLPGGKLRPEAIPQSPVVQPIAPGPVVAVPAAPKPAAPKPAAPPAPAPQLTVGSGGGVIVSNAMKYLGYRYLFGGTSPSGFDCSGFVYYIHNRSGSPVGRGMWQQYNGGSHVPMNALQPGDTLFFANTYMPGLSHDGIYIGNGQFIHASDERTGVTISSLYTGYWQVHYVGATRLWD
jgi:peptidoglycan DL-endopeptidase LytE